MNTPSRFPSDLTTARVCILVVLLWAGIYLPALGSMPLRLEEPRRALPALRMLTTGDWLVPRIGDSVYLRKPPLLNWLIALSFGVTGGPGDWAARLPSALVTLALALTVVGVAGRVWLGAAGGLLAAVFFLTNITLIQIGRLAELEALYVALTGIALTLWLTAWRSEVSPWRLWLFPAPLLALGMLTKGPTHLIFYYGIVVPVLVRGRDLRSFWHPAHGLALLMTAGVFLAWAIPCARAVGEGGQDSVWSVWLHQLGSRASTPSGGRFNFASWLLNVPQGLKNFLPWTLLLPVLWRREIVSRFDTGAPPVTRERALFLGMRWGMTATFLAMSLLPGGSPRYIYPLVIVPCLLLALVLTRRPWEGGRAKAIPGLPSWLFAGWRWANIGALALATVAGAAIPAFERGGNRVAPWLAAVAIPVAAFILIRVAWRRARPSGLVDASDGFIVREALTTGAVMVLAMLAFALAVVPWINRNRSHGPREIAAQIRSAIPPGTSLWVQDKGYCAFWYYIEPGVTYFTNAAEVPPEARYFLVRAGSADRFTKELRARRVGVSFQTRREIIDDHTRLVLLEASPGSDEVDVR